MAPIPKIQNVVAVFNLGCELNLMDIVDRARNVEYNPKRSLAATMRIQKPRGTAALIYKSGKVCCVGAKSEAECRTAARRYARIIQKLGYKVKFLNFRITTVSANCNVRFRIKLEDLARAHYAFVSYIAEIESVPAYYRMAQPRVVFAIYYSGKVVLTGAKSESDVNEAFTNIYPILKTFEIKKK